MGMKLLLIIAFWEAIIMFTLAELGPYSPMIDGILDTCSLTLLSGLSIWFFLILPEKKKTQQLSSSIRLLDQEIHAIDQIAIISATDLKGKIIYTNENFCNITGYTHEELLGQDHRIINSGIHSKEVFKDLWLTLQAGKPWRNQIRNKKKNGETYWVNAHVIPIFDADNRPYKYLSFRFDITAEKLAEEALEQEKMKGIHLSRLSAIGEMAAGMAHEINNPLTIIMGQLLSIERKMQVSIPTEEENKKNIENLHKTKHQVTRITKIINGLQAFSRADEKQAFEQVSSKKIFNVVGDLCFEKLNEIGVKLEMPQNEIEFLCNQIQIEQVLVNLVNNAGDAISTLAERWIKISVELVAAFVEISVTDSGPGIPPEIISKLMQPFFTTKGIGKGTGLGLSISRGIIEKHSGNFFIDATSPNTRFVIQLPQNETALIHLLNFDEAIEAHLAWRRQITNFLATSNPKLDSEKVCLDNQCDLGKWIYKIEPRFKNNPHFIELKKTHADFHRVTANIVLLANEGKLTEPEASLGPDSDFGKLSQKIISKLNIFRQSPTIG
jgi:PAS domain S-box-containing protein